MMKQSMCRMLTAFFSRSIRPASIFEKSKISLIRLSSVSPLFILWAIRGTALIPDVYFLTFCAAMVVGPNAFLWYRIRIARQRDDTRELAIAAVEDNREHLLVYLFAMLLPFYADTLATWRTLAAALAGLGFVVFMFWHLNLHYMNILRDIGKRLEHPHRLEKTKSTR
jgi:hypothetical protein